MPIQRDDLAERLHHATGAKPLLIPGGKKVCERIGVVTGGAGNELKRAAGEGVEAPGEAPLGRLGRSGQEQAKGEDQPARGRKDRSTRPVVR